MAVSSRPPSGLNCTRFPADAQPAAHLTCKPARLSDSSRDRPCRQAKPTSDTWPRQRAAEVASGTRWIDAPQVPGWPGARAQQCRPCTARAPSPAQPPARPRTFVRARESSRRPPRQRSSSASSSPKPVHHPTSSASRARRRCRAGRSPIWWHVCRLRRRRRTSPARQRSPPAVSCSQPAKDSSSSPAMPAWVDMKHGRACRRSLQARALRARGRGGARPPLQRPMQQPGTSAHLPAS